MPKPGRSWDEAVRRAHHASWHNYALCAALYAAFVVYGSLVLGPEGLHFVPRDPAYAWQRFLNTSIIENGSDQRPDWIANLLLLVPLGFLLQGALASGRTTGRRIFGSLIALLLGLTFVLAVKYAQLFFPPRTVTLNYIIAQSIGVVAGQLLLAPD